MIHSSVQMLELRPHDSGLHVCFGIFSGRDWPFQSRITADCAVMDGRQPEAET